MKENWRPVVGYEGLYKVSDWGWVKSLHHHKSRILTSYVTPRGYLVVTLYKNGKRKTVKVHRLVAMAFISNPENKPEANHKNKIRSDPRAENLEWVTKKENNSHRDHFKDPCLTYLKVFFKRPPISGRGKKSPLPIQCH